MALPLLDVAANARTDPKGPPRCFIGFDGVTDELLDVVDRWRAQGDYEAMETMEVLGRRLLEYAGKSCNIDIIPKLTKIGGNGPILARALLEGGHDITLVAPLGAKEIEPLFQPLVQGCSRIVSLGPSAYTQALEFCDGKVMLGKLQVYKEITWKNLLQKIPLQEFIEIQEKIDLFVSASWTNVLGTNAIWQGIVDEVMPHLSKRKRWMYVDLADPAKRTEQDIRTALTLLQTLTDKYAVILGLNRSESYQVGKLLGYAVDHVDHDNMESVGQEIHQRLGIAQVVLHTAHLVTLSHEEGSCHAEVPHCAHPKITTGAGDNFNAGFLNGLLRGLPPLQCLVSGVATSGFYVRNAKSPTMEELAIFLRLWHDQKL